jgi:hypothetical protein
MHPFFREEILRDNQRNLERKLVNAHHFREHELAAAPPAEPVMLRLSSVHDDDVLHDLAVFGGHREAPGQHVVAEVGGVIVAALPLGPGPALADPFRRTTHLMPLLELRAKQLSDDSDRRRSRAWRAVLAWGRP